MAELKTAPWRLDNRKAFEDYRHDKLKLDIFLMFCNDGHYVWLIHTTQCGQ